MKRIAIWTTFVLVTTFSTSLLAADEPAEKPDETSKKGGWTGYLDKEFEKIGGMDLYGVTSQLPQGYMSVKWDWGTIRAKNRYNNRRRLGPVMEPITFTDGNGNELINIDMGLNGYGGGHTFQMSYGITDPLDWYIELPFTYMNVSFEPKMQKIKNADGSTYKDADGNEYNIHPSLAPLLGIKDPQNFTACEFMYETLPALGRPTPATEFHGKWMLGDINTGFSWNIYRTHRFSVALTPRVFLPTGHKAHPNNNLLWGTGPEIETGIGGWAAGFTQGYDLRVFQHIFKIGGLPIPLDIIASTEFAASYGFPQKREYPDNFPSPNPLASTLDPTAFPDLSHLKDEGTFTYTPGWGVSWLSQLQVQFAIFGLGVAYGIQHSQEPELIGDRNFLMMAKGLELLGQQTIEAVQVAGSISLLPFYIPIDIAFQYRKVIDGYNAIVFDDFYQLTVKGYIPLKMLWD